MFDEQKLTIQKALYRAFSAFQEANLDNPRQEAEILFSSMLGWSRLKLFLEADTILPLTEVCRLQEAIDRRAKGEPLAYITGNREFYGLEFAVNRTVLIPRPESEFLIDTALKWANRIGYDRGEEVRLVDLGTGSGNLVVTLAVKWPRARFWAVDISFRALSIADENASRHGVQDRISWHCGDYFSAFSSIDPLPRFNVIISNPPYIPRNKLPSLHPTVKEYEPTQALDGGADGMEGYRKLFSNLPCHLLKPALVAVEIGTDQLETVTDLFKSSGLFHRLEIIYDYQDQARVVAGFNG